MLRAVGDECEIEARQATNPVMLNNRSVTRARLRHGDNVTIGRTSFVFPTTQKLIRAMAVIKFTCPHCSQTLEAPEEAVRQQVRLPICNQTNRSADARAFNPAQFKETIKQPNARLFLPLH